MTRGTFNVCKIVFRRLLCYFYTKLCLTTCKNRFDETILTGGGTYDWVKKHAL